MTTHFVAEANHILFASKNIQITVVVSVSYTMFTYIVFFSMVVATTLATYGVDVSQPASTSAFQCLKSTFLLCLLQCHVIRVRIQTITTFLPLFVYMKKQVVLIQMVHKLSKMLGLVVWPMQMDTCFLPSSQAILLNRSSISLSLTSQ